MTTTEIQEYTGLNVRKLTDQELDAIIDYMREELKNLIIEYTEANVDVLIDVRTDEGAEMIRKEMADNSVMLDFSLIGEKIAMCRELRLYSHCHYSDKEESLLEEMLSKPVKKDKEHHHIDIEFYYYRFDNLGFVCGEDTTILHYCLKKEKS